MIVQDTIIPSKPAMRDSMGDGGRWMIVFAAFIVQFIVCGITYCLGIFHIIFQDVFSQDHFDTSWAGSILLYVTALSSKFVCMQLFVTLCLINRNAGLQEQDSLSTWASQNVSVLRNQLRLGLSEKIHGPLQKNLNEA